MSVFCFQIVSKKEEKPLSNLMQCTLSLEELTATAKRIVEDCCNTGGRAWTMRLPVDFDRDADVILSETITRLEEACELITELGEALRFADYQNVSGYFQKAEMVAAATEKLIKWERKQKAGGI